MPKELILSQLVGIIGYGVSAAICSVIVRLAFPIFTLFQAYVICYAFVVFVISLGAK
jgi:hypothetical protein